MAARIYVGTPSWNEKPLIETGRFYPPDVKDAGARLAFYSQRFNSTEIDRTYYAFIPRRLSEGWVAAAPEGFRFVVKAFALFTQHPTRPSSIPRGFHEGIPDEVLAKRNVYYKDIPESVRDELWALLRRQMDPLREAGKLGAVLIDFPPWFVPSEANRAFLAEVREHLPDDELLVELRSRLWVSDEDSSRSTFAALRDLRCGFVCVDEPPGLESGFPPVTAVTGRVAAVRFRGRNAERWQDRSASTEERFNWWYTDEELAEWLPRIRKLAGEAEEVYVSFSTKGEDQGVVNAARMQRMLDAV